MLVPHLGEGRSVYSQYMLYIALYSLAQSYIPTLIDIFSFGHTHQKALDPVRSPKLSW